MKFEPRRLTNSGGSLTTDYVWHTILGLLVNIFNYIINNIVTKISYGQWSNVITIVVYFLGAFVFVGLAMIFISENNPNNRRVKN